LKALLTIMATGSHEGKDLNDPEIRKLFTRENLLASEWYAERLRAQQRRDHALFTRFVDYLTEVRSREGNEGLEADLKLGERLEKAHRRLVEIQSPSYLTKIRGTIGADPFHLQMTSTSPAAKEFASF
jgi:phosphoenolpyruvate carboxykinase (diphosphate)